MTRFLQRELKARLRDTTEKAWQNGRPLALVNQSKPTNSRHKLRPEIEVFLLEVAHQTYPGERINRELEQLLDEAFGPVAPSKGVATGSESKGDLRPRRVRSKRVGVRDHCRRLSELGRDEARDALLNAFDTKYRSEMREMEKVLLLQILDSSWMEHLRAMDHLRSSVGLQGYAQIDPKVEYKREGMKIFSEMWNGVSDKVTDMVFRVEQFDPDFLSYLGCPLAARSCPDDPPSGPLGAGRAPPPHGVVSGRNRRPRSPRASRRPKRRPSPCEILEKRLAETTLARAVPVKNSKPAA